ncbi:MAG: T9SS type A sorting domain-containing protein [Chitinophagales bacterium]|nr:T9SS type A sorting domain-containing protein [Chitinophagales bacterium]
MKRRSFFFSTILITVCLSTLVFNSFSQGMVYLDANNVKAGFFPGGNLFSESVNGNFERGSYEVPIGSGKNSIFTTSLWLSGIDNSNSLHGAVTRYGANDDWVAGPISTQYDSLYDSLYKRVYKVSKQEIDLHRANFLNLGYTVPNEIQQWPGNGRTQFNETAQMAPFVDLNSNGIYEPALGDYPDIIGEQAVFFILNDVKSTSSYANCLKMNVELHVLAYAVFCNQDSVLNNTIFLRLKFINKSANDYHGVCFSNYVDPDLGCYRNDRVGCDTLSNSYYAYNGTANDPDGCIIGLKGYTDTSIVQGFTFLNQQMTGFNFYNNSPGGQMGDPTLCNEYRNYQTGKFRDGTPLRYGGNGYLGTGAITPFCFPGNPNDPLSWSEVHTQTADSIVPGDRRIVSTIFIDTFKVNQQKVIDIASVSTLSTTIGNIELVNTFLSDIQHVRSLYQQQFNYCGQVYSGIQNANELPLTVELFPNPTAGKLTVKLPNLVNEAQLQLMSIQGQEVKQMSTSLNETTLDLSSLAKGVYLLKVQWGENSSTKRFIIE